MKKYVNPFNEKREKRLEDLYRKIEGRTSAKEFEDIMQEIRSIERQKEIYEYNAKR